MEEIYIVGVTIGRKLGCFKKQGILTYIVFCEIFLEAKLPSHVLTCSILRIIEILTYD